MDEKRRRAIAAKLAKQKKFMENEGIPIIKQAIETGRNIWVTTDKHGRCQITPHKIVENELHCDVLLVSNLDDATRRNAVINIDEIHKVSFMKDTLG